MSNVANPATGQQKLFDIDDERKTRIFIDKRMGQEVDVDALGDEWKGCRLKITGGNNTIGVPMMQGVLVSKRVKLLLDERHNCWRAKRKGDRRRKSVRGCIVNTDITVLACVLVKQGEKEIPGLTDQVLPARLGPKRATKIRRYLNLSKEDDVRKYVKLYARTIEPKKEGGKPYTKSPKIQRLVTPMRLQRRRHLHSLKVRKTMAQKEQKAEYDQIVAKRTAENKQNAEALKAKHRADFEATHAH